MSFPWENRKQHEEKKKTREGQEPTTLIKLFYLPFPFRRRIFFRIGHKWLKTWLDPKPWLPNALDIEDAANKATFQIHLTREGVPEFFIGPPVVFAIFKLLFFPSLAGVCKLSRVLLDCPEPRGRRLPGTARAAGLG